MEAERALAKLDQQLQFARDLVQAFPNEKAENLLKKAFEERNKARLSFRQKRFNAVRAHVLQAKNFIDIALKLVLEGPVNRQRERLQELIRRADNIVVGSGNIKAEQLLRKAKSNQKLALQAFRERKFRQAVEFYRTAIFLAERSIALAGRRFKNIEERYIGEKERFEQLLERAKIKVEQSGGEEARRLLLQAVRQTQKAQEAVRKKNYPLAIDTYYQATRLLIRAIDLAEKEPLGLRRKVEQELGRLEDLIFSAKDQIESSRNPRSQLLFKEALNFNSRARSAFQEGRFREAMSKADIAKKFLRQAVRLQEGESFRPEEKIREELTALEERLRILSSQVRKDQDQAITFLDKAQHHFNEAQKALNAERFRLALERIWISSRFASKVEDFLKKREGKVPSMEAVKRKLERLETAIMEIEPEVESSKIVSAKVLLAQAHEMKDKAKKAIAGDHVYLASENIDIAIEMLLKAARLMRK